MINFIIENIAPLMFFVLILFLLSGFPVAFALAANGLLFAWLGIELGLLQPTLLQALPNRILGIMQNETLLAIPFFGLMGMILERSGMAEDLLETIGQLFGSVRGGIAYAVIFVGALLAATTGIVAASVISMGLISLPIMLRYQYSHRLASGVIVASGTLAQIIPPSLVLIILADQLGRSVKDIYQGALIPGLGLALLYVLYVFCITLIKPNVAPALPESALPPKHERGGLRLLLLMLISAAVSFALIEQFAQNQAFDRQMVYGVTLTALIMLVVALINRVGKLKWLSVFAEKVILVLIPPLGLIFLVLGTIFIGMATPTEGGAMGATGALILALSKRRLNFKLLSEAVDSTARLSCFVIFILIGSSVFSLVFRGVSGDLWVEHLLTNLPGGQAGFLIFVNVLFFLLAFFLDFFELVFILVPLLAPVADKMGIDLVWFAVMLGVNMQTSFMHPPFGFALFYLRSVAPKAIKTTDIYWGAVPFIGIQLLMVALIVAFPKIVQVEKHVISSENPDLNIDLPIQAPEPMRSAPQFEYTP